MSVSDAVQQTERAPLGCLPLDKSLWPQTKGLSVGGRLRPVRSEGNRIQ
jgi:hypothetical protein